MSLQRGDFIQLVEKVPVGDIRYFALDEGDGNHAFAIGDRLDLVERASELRTPTLILHSDGDTFVPIDGSLALARARPDIVRLERFIMARHTRLWNYDSRRWERAIRTWVSSLG